nr:hypothetical protein CFP56_66053 [Quercus suber]
MASSQKLTEYERKRLENIRRNDEMMAALKIHSKATELSASSSAKRQRYQKFSATIIRFQSNHIFPNPNDN